MTLTWLAPTENVDGTALTNLSGYVIYYGTSADTMTNKVAINTVGISTYMVTELNSGTWYFAVVAVNSAGEESTLSDVATTSI